MNIGSNSNYLFTCHDNSCSDSGELKGQQEYQVVQMEIKRNITFRNDCFCPFI